MQQKGYLTSIRFYLFCKSYPGYIFKNQISDICICNRLSKSLGFSCDPFKAYVLRNKIPTIGKYLQKEQRIYLKIENQLITLANEKLDSSSIMYEENQSFLLSLAIERVVGSTLGNVKDDNVFEEKLNQRIKDYHRIYYKTAYKYRLPTMRIIPFLLRLITL